MDDKELMAMCRLHVVIRPDLHDRIVHSPADAAINAKSIFRLNSSDLLNFMTVKAVWLLLTIGQAYLLSRFVSQISNNNTIHYGLYKVVGTSVNGTLDSNLCSLQFAVMHDDCFANSKEVDRNFSTTFTDQYEVVRSIETSKDVNGFRVWFSERDCEFHEIHISGAADWTGSWTALYHRQLSQSTKSNEMNHTMTTLEFDLRPTWPTIVWLCVENAVSVATTVLFLACSVRWKSRAMNLLCLGLAVEGLVSLVAGFGFLSTPTASESFEPINHGLICLLLCWLVVARDISFLFQGAFTFALGLWRICIYFIQDCGLAGDCGRLENHAFHPLCTILLFLGPTYVAMGLWEARGLVAVMAEDAKRWDGILNSCCDGFDRTHSHVSETSRMSDIERASSGASTSSPPVVRRFPLERVQSASSVANSQGPRRLPFDRTPSIGSSMASTPARRRAAHLAHHRVTNAVQFCWRSPSTWFRGVQERVVSVGGLSNLLPLYSHEQATSSLDQLYAQAYEMVEVLDLKCRDWAAKSDGQCFYDSMETVNSEWNHRSSDSNRDLCPDSLAQLYEALRGTGTEAWMKLGCIKDPARAIQKVRACYGGAASRLTDVCRHRLLFSSPRHIMACLKYMRHDAEVRIVKIKGKRGGDHRLSAGNGFRGMIIKLCIVNDTTHHFNSTRHVCEVQLILTCFTNIIQDPSLHARYLAYRDVRVHVDAVQRFFVAFQLPKREQMRIFPTSSAGSQDEPRDSPRRHQMVSKQAPSSILLSPGTKRALDMPPSPQPAQDHAAPSVVDFAAARSEAYLDGPSQVVDGMGKSPSACSDAPDKNDGTASCSRAVSAPIAAIELYNGTQVAGIDQGDATVESSSASKSNVVLQHDLEDALEQVEHIRTSQPGNYLTPRLEDYRATLQRAHFNSLIFTSEPAAAALSKHRFQVFTMFWAIYYAYWTLDYAILMSQDVLDFSGVENHYVRVNLTAGSASELEWASPDPARISSFGLMSRQCKVLANVSFVEQQDGYSVLEFPGRVGPQPVNGYYFSMSNCSEAGCPTHWTVEIFDGGRQSWRMVGASYWRFDSDSGEIQFVPSVSYLPFLANNTEIVVQDVINWEWVLEFLVVSIICCVSWVLISTASLFKRERLGISICGAYLISNALIYIVLLISNLQRGRYTASLLYFMFFIPSMWFGLGILLYQKQVVNIMMIFGLLKLISRVLESNLYPYSISQRLAVAYSTGPLVVLFCFILIFFRQWALMKSRKLVQSDKQHYDQVWNDVSHSCPNNEIVELRKLVKRITKQRKNGPQHSHLQGNSRNFQGRLSSDSVSFTTVLSIEANDEDARQGGVSNLEQLYCQAHILHPILLDKVKSWAFEARGMLPVHKPGDGGEAPLLTYMRWSDICENEELVRSVVWPKIKSTERSLEKILRSYQKDATRLVDICRASLVFESVVDLIACLNTMWLDDVDLLRVKNRLDPDYDSSRSAGYRDVCVNIHLRNPISRLLGLDQHVCEVQLILQPFAELKSSKGHHRYVLFRDLRGE
mmetsp:Transcript_58167/g.152916  ORF Transcript_58167/g.152916 Transcript_58167/m.152916 type:complete len:1521 (-) Transcript_58167:439-5001(-)